MNLFRHLTEHGHEQMIFSRDEATGLRAIISIHDSSRGRALGGVRYQSYPNEEAAVMDALRLSEAMTYKFAAAGLSYGGAKAVIIKQGEPSDRVALFRAFGRVVESLQGRFGTGEDVGTTPEDMAAIALETKHVTGLPESMGGEGDPSPVTALGVLQGMRAGVGAVFGNDSLKGRTVAIQGLGHVGYNLARRLHDEGARLIVSDTSNAKVQRAVEEFGAEAMAADEIYDAACDVFAPCALGATLSRETIGRLRCRIVAGAANNQLSEPLDGRLLEAKGILYLPDFVINAGGVLFLTYRLRGVTEQDAFTETEGIYHTTRRVIDISRSSQIPTSEAAFVMARERVKAS
ncbi:MAG TPA: Glu/Leu/Phe/Val dehydrogenase dimerization domain-containing protein [Pyrinomonadaceae bacterium]|nr:Glu/Leu/Phe/Val dehydrogenase dimerization domain-containing protein [Pyrinomonadaceae bacterium]